VRHHFFELFVVNNVKPRFLFEKLSVRLVFVQTTWRVSPDYSRRLMNNPGESSCCGAGDFLQARPPTRIELV
jgi:hypothetical protein